MATLDDMGLPVRIWSMPVEIPSPIRVRARHGSSSRTIWSRATGSGVSSSQVHRVFTECRCGFIGKCSPVHFFWGAFDLAVTRFSGRPAPPREGPAFMREAYSHEVISHGFWPGSGPVLEPAFYAYAVPEPQGLKTARIQPEGRTTTPNSTSSSCPTKPFARQRRPTGDRRVRQSTYEQAATLAGWDRPALERAQRGSGKAGSGHCPLWLPALAGRQAWRDIVVGIPEESYCERRS